MSAGSGRSTKTGHISGEAGSQAGQASAEASSQAGQAPTEPGSIRAADLAGVRARTPERIQAALQHRAHATFPPKDGRVVIIAADHPARAALGVGSNEMAMADRIDLLERCAIALGRPGVGGFLGTADMVEDLALMGALEGKIVFGSMNRGGIPGAVFEADDRFTGYDGQGVAAAGLDGGKMLLRIDPDDPATAGALAACAGAVDDLHERGLTAMIEPFWSHRAGGKLTNDLDPEAVIRSIAIAQALGQTSARTWLKLPACADIERVLAATTLPVVLLGGEVGGDDDRRYHRWQRAMAAANFLGLAIGRTVLYPPGGDVRAAVDAAVAAMKEN